MTSHSTGASGYIGGDILSELIAKYPEHKYRVLVRSEANGQKIQKIFPDVAVIFGNLDDSELLTRESAAADIIIRKEHYPIQIAELQSLTQPYTLL